MKITNLEDGSSQIIYTRETDSSKELSTEEYNMFMWVFYPQTIEDYHRQEKISSDLLKEVEEFLPYFTRMDALEILHANNSKDFLYTIARVIWRIRSEQFILRINGVDTFSVQVTNLTRGRFQEVLSKEQESAKGKE